MQAITISKAAAGYRALWEGHERDLHAKFADIPDTDDLRRAMHGFRISRSFKGIGESNDPGKQKAKSIIRQLLIVEDNNDTVASVVGLTDSFEVEFGRRNLSAASKLLWLRHRAPYVIYDSLAVKELMKLGHRKIAGDYNAFVSAWRMEFDKRSTEIALATKALPPLSDGQDKDSPWFLERVFDKYLWDLGKQTQS